MPCGRRASRRADRGFSTVTRSEPRSGSPVMMIAVGPAPPNECFDGPARAIGCAQATVEATRPLGIDVRLGLHTGECEVRGDDLGGLAVHIAARVGALAGPGEVLVSGTVKDLVVGSGIAFVDRGERQLKGVPGDWKLFAVGSTAP